MKAFYSDYNTLISSANEQQNQVFSWNLVMKKTLKKPDVS